MTWLMNNESIENFNETNLYKQSYVILWIIELFITLTSINLWY